MDQASTSAASSSEIPVDWSPNCKYMKFRKVIGKGGFKKVFLGMNSDTSKSVAWCELLEGNRTERRCKKFRAEARMLRKLHHPNILKYCDFWETNSQIVMITELMTTGTLKTHLRQVQRIKLSELKSWCLQVLRGLSYLHSRKPVIVHRDLKCDNLFLDIARNRVKIGDFGLATIKRHNYLTSDVGTVRFKAPEMFARHYDEAADIYAFGMSVLEMVTGHYPYNECRTHEEIKQKVLMGILPASLAGISNVKVRGLILACTQTLKDNRPACTDLMDWDLFSEPTEGQLVVSLEETTPVDSLKEVQIPEMSKVGLMQKPNSA